MIYNVSIESTERTDIFHITWSTPGSNSVSFKGAITITQEDIRWLWQLPRHREIIGKKLFGFLDGEGYHFQQALEQAHWKAESLQINIYTCKGTHDWPFEVLSKNGIFLFSQYRHIHLVRRTGIPSSGGKETAVSPKNRPLRLLFMASSVMDSPHELDFELEEETIFQITEDLPMEMDVEDSGSLEGLRRKLEQEEYDVIHLSGHAGLDENGKPYFTMEEETGKEQKIFPGQLWNEALIKNPPRLMVLSGSRTAETPDRHDILLNEAESSFAHMLVEKYNVPAVLGWGRKVDDRQTIYAGKMLFLQLSRGLSIVDAVQRTRFELNKKFSQDTRPAWPLLRLYAGPGSLEALVKVDQSQKAKPRRMTHIYLKNSRVKVLEHGFVGRRRQLQKSLTALKTDVDKTGLLIMGTGGLGKSCLAGKICERFTDHTLIIIRGRVNTLSLEAALIDAFFAGQDEEGKRILSQKIKMTDRLIHLCSASFKERNYLFLLDDFEQNLEGFEKGEPGEIFPETADLLGVLLHYLPFSSKMSQVVVTSRYEFALQYQGCDIIEKRLGKIWLIAFDKAEQRKKLTGLKHIFNFEDREVGRQLLAAGYGNPRLMEWIDRLAMHLKVKEAKALAVAVADKQEEFIRGHVIRELLKEGGTLLGRFLRWFSIYRIPAGEEGVSLLAKKARVKEWKDLLRKGVSLSLVEFDQIRGNYQVTPLLREELLKGLRSHLSCHKVAFTYFKKLCEAYESLDPVLTEEWIYHALGCGEEVVVSEQGGKLVAYYRDNLAYLEAKRMGEWVLAEKRQPLFTQHDGYLLNELGIAEKNLGNYHKSIDYYQQALKILKKACGEPHPDVASSLSNLGTAWDEFCDNNKAIDYYSQVFEMDVVVFGNQHPRIANDLNNLGAAYDSLGDFHKSIDYYQQALEILKKVYGDIHPKVALSLNNLGAAFDGLGDFRKAIEYYLKALKIFKTVYGETHPDVAISLNNLGSAWNDLGDQNKAIDYYQQALEIDEAVFGKKHPKVARDLNNLGEAWRVLGEPKRAKDYCQQALEIDEVFFGKQHPQIAPDLNNLALAWDALEDYPKAIDYHQQALEIWKAFYGDKHPNVAVSLNNLGSVYDSLGDYFRAIQHYSKALETLKKAYGEIHPDVAISLNNLGSSWINLGEHRKSIDYSQQALEILRKVYGEIHPDVALSLNKLGDAFYGLGDFHKAIDYYLQVFKIDEVIFGKQHPEVANDLNNLGMAYFDLNQPQKATPYFEQALDIFYKSLGEDHHYTLDTKDWLKKSRKEEKLLKKFRR